MRGGLMIPARAVQFQGNQASVSVVGADGTMAAQWTATYARMKVRDSADTSRGGGFGYAAALLESQRAWLKFRDTHCVIEGGEFAGGSLPGMTMAQIERAVIEATLRETRGNRRRAAELLGIGERTLYRKIREIEGEIGGNVEPDDYITP